jgi:gamma-glutamyltranspeptidase
MVYRKAMRTGALDYREAPLAATKDMFLDKGGNVIEGKVQQRPHLHPEFLNSCWFICCP